jgi:hypothetical protein
MKDRRLWSPVWGLLALLFLAGGLLGYIEAVDKGQELLSGGRPVNMQAAASG